MLFSEKKKLSTKSEWIIHIDLESNRKQKVKASKGKWDCSEVDVEQQGKTK